MIISFKEFVNAIQEAIVNAATVLMDKNLSLLDKYFVENPKEEAQEGTKGTLVPKSVILEYPHVNSEGTIENLEVAVPLITLVPLSMSQLDNAKLSANFEMEVVNNELQLHFSDKSHAGMFTKKPKTAWGTIEMSFSPQETPEGFKALVEGYEAILKRQIS